MFSFMLVVLVQVYARFGRKIPHTLRLKGNYKLYLEFQFIFEHLR